MDIQPISGSGGENPFAELARIMQQRNCGTNLPVTSADEAIRIVNETEDG